MVFQKSVNDLRQNQIYAPFENLILMIFYMVLKYRLFKVKHFITLIFYAQSTYCLDMASAPNIVIEGEST